MIAPGAQFAHYRIEALLGEGGMGQVYRAFDETLHRRVALKVLTVDDATAAQRMVREARAAAALEHPNKVSVFELGEVGGTPYLAMELITGPTLRAMVGDRSVTWQEVVAWLLDVARALDAAHVAGIVHRDIKPENVMLREDGVVKVLDFGIARRAQVQADPTGPTAMPGVASATGGTIAGTAAYMAPEQLRGDALDGRCDQFAWGVMAFELLTGEHPWGGGREGLAQISAMLTSKPRSLGDVRPGLPSKLSEIVAKALSGDRDRRYPSMRALASELGALVGQSDRGRPRAGAGKSNDNLASAPTETSPLVASTTSPSSVPDTASRRSERSGGARTMVMLGVVAVAAAAGVLAALRGPHKETVGVSTPASSSSSSTSPSADAPPPTLANANAVPGASVYPCKDTKRPVPPHGLDRTCSDEAVAWCNQSMSVIACCAEELIPDGDEGACGCPPSGDPSGLCPNTTPLKPGQARLEPAEIQKVVRANFGATRICFEDALKRTPKLNGKVAIEFEIDRAGGIFFARIEEGIIPDAKAQKCVLEAFRGLRFPPPIGGVVSVIYPIMFSPDD